MRRVAKPFAKTALLAFRFFVIGQVCCEGFDFTLSTNGPVLLDGFPNRFVCGFLHCTETLTHGSDSQANRSRSLTGFTISRLRVGGDGSAIGRWQELASVTPQRPMLEKVSDGLRASGELTDHNASLSIQMTKTHDCTTSQFSCVAVSVDEQGAVSVKKSLVGKAVDPRDTGPETRGSKFSTPLAKAPPSDEPVNLAGTLGQLVSSVQARFDWAESRLMDSINALDKRLDGQVEEIRSAIGDRAAGLDTRLNGLENNVKDKVGELRAVIHDKAGEADTNMRALDTRLDSLENRLEDKIERVAETVRAETCRPDVPGQFDQLVSKLGGLENTMASQAGMLNSCVAEVRKQIQDTDELSASLSGQLNTLTASVQAVQQNVTNYCDRDVENMKAAVTRCVNGAASGDAKITELISDVANLSDLTHDLVSRAGSIRDAYVNGALMPMNEFFDPLGTGNNEWRLVFRGTAYNNVRVYPAYMHGTGIPPVVENGCKQFNRSLSCVNHYRNKDAFDKWVGIDKVLFAIYKDGEMVKRVVFDGKGSTFTDWFSADRVLSSSWSDLATHTHVYFSIFGVDHGNHFRRFYMSSDERTCASFGGWFKAAETAVGCPVEVNVPAVPVFQYAPGDTRALWSSTASAADAIGIYLKYQ